MATTTVSQTSGFDQSQQPYSVSTSSHSYYENMKTLREVKADLAVMQHEKIDLELQLKQYQMKYQRQSIHTSNIEKELVLEKGKLTKLQEDFNEYMIKSCDERDGLATCLRQQALSSQLICPEFQDIAVDSFSKKLSSLEKVHSENETQLRQEITRRNQAEQNNRILINKSQKLELLCVNMVQQMESHPDFYWHANQTRLILDEILSPMNANHASNSISHSTSPINGSSYRRISSLQNLSQGHYIGGVPSQITNIPHHGSDSGRVVDSVRLRDDEIQDELSLLRMEIKTLKGRVEDTLDRNQELEDEKNSLLRQLWSCN